MANLKKDSLGTSMVGGPGVALGGEMDRSRESGEGQPASLALVCDLDGSKVLHVADGRSWASLDSFFEGPDLKQLKANDWRHRVIAA